VREKTRVSIRGKAVMAGGQRCVGRCVGWVWCLGVWLAVSLVLLLVTPLLLAFRCGDWVGFDVAWLGWLGVGGLVVCVEEVGGFGGS